MIVPKRNWTIASSLLVAAAVGLPAFSQELLPPPVVGGPTRELLEPTPANSVPPVSSPTSAAPLSPGAVASAGNPGWRERWLRTYRERIWGYPEEFADAPLGRSVNAHIGAQVGGGQAARMVLYQYDFEPLSDQLKPRGKVGLQRIAGWLPCCFCPIYVEPTPGRPDLDEARRKIVWQELAGCANPVSSDRILIGRPGSAGLSGVEAILIERNLLQQTSARGTLSGGGGAAGANVSGGGASSTSNFAGGTEIGN